MTIFVYKGLSRNPEIGNTTEFHPLSGDWGELVIQKFGTAVSNKMTEYCKMSGLYLLPFLSYEKQKPLLTQIRIKVITIYVCTKFHSIWRGLAFGTKFSPKALHGEVLGQILPENNLF